MFCSQCGKEINEMAKFCSNCGASITEEGDKPIENVPKKNKAGLLVGLFVLLLVLVAGGVTVFVVNSPVNKIHRAFAAGNVDAAIALYNDVTSEKDVEKVVGYACSYAEQLKEDYLNESTDMDCQAVCNALAKLDVGLTDDNKEIAEVKSAVELIGASRANYLGAQEAEAAEEYIKALELYATVIVDDPVYYEKAQAAIVNVSGIIRTDAIAKVRSFADAGDFEGAIREMDNALGILKEDADLLAEKVTLDQQIIDDYVSKAETAVGEQRYTDAIVLINNALEQYPDNESVIRIKDMIPEEVYLVGNWEFTYDMSGIISDLYEDFEKIDMSLEMSIIMSFREDGTYYYTIDKESFIDTYSKYVLEFFYISLEEYGTDRDEIDELYESLYGIDLEAYIRMLCIDEFELISEDLSGGDYYTVEGNKLYIGGNENYEIFTVSGDTLTLDLPGNNAGAEIFPGFNYPLTLHKVENIIVAEGTM